MKVRWNGETGSICHEIGAATGGSSELEHGKEYAVSTELGEALIESHAGWEAVPAPKTKEAPKS